MVTINSLSAPAKDVVRQLFLDGPTHADDIASAAGRLEVVEESLAEDLEGWVYLTERGVHIGLKMGLESVKRIRRENTAKLAAEGKRPG